MPDPQFGRQRDPPRAAAVAAFEQQLPRRPALLQHRLPDRGQAGALGLRHAVEAGDREVVGHPQTAVGGVAQRAEGEDVRGADDRGELRVRREQLGRRRLARLHRVVEPLPDGHARPVDADLGQAVAQPGEAVALHRVGDLGLPGGRHPTVVPLRGQAHADHADAPVAQPGEVPGQAQHGFAVVDADPVDALDARRLVADHRRHGPLQHGEEVRVVLADGVDDEAVDARTVHCGDVRMLGAHRHQQQPLARRLARQREPLEEAGGHGVAEGVRQRLGEQQPDGPGPPGAQRTCHGVGTGVAQPPGGLQDAFPQRRRQLVRPVVGVRDSRPGNTQLGGQRRERGGSAHLGGPGHGRTVAAAPDARNPGRPRRASITS